MSNRTHPHPLQKPIPSGWEKPLQAWVTSLRAEGKSDRTLDTRIRHVRQLARQLGCETPSHVTADALIEWCGEKAWSPETRHSYYTSFGLFFAHVTRSRDDAENPAAALPSVRRPPTLPRPAPDPIVNSAVVEAAPRTALILALAAELGLRAHEVAKVHKDDIHHDLFGLALTVRGKGGKDRTIPLSTGLGTRILAACRATPSGFAFPGQIDGHLSARWVSKHPSPSRPGTAGRSRPRPHQKSQYATPFDHRPRTTKHPLATRPKSCFPAMMHPLLINTPNPSVRVDPSIGWRSVATAVLSRHGCRTAQTQGGVWA